MPKMRRDILNLLQTELLLWPVQLFPIEAVLAGQVASGRHKEGKVDRKRVLLKKKILSIGDYVEEIHHALPALVSPKRPLKTPNIHTVSLTKIKGMLLSAKTRPCAFPRKRKKRTLRRKKKKSTRVSSAAKNAGLKKTRDRK